MKCEWPVVSLETLVERKIGYGIVQPGESIPHGIPVIKAGDIVSGLSSIDQLETTAPENAAKYGRTALRGGELVITVVGTVGRTAIVPNSFQGCNLVRATAMIDIPDPILSLWVKYYIDSPEGQHYLLGNLNTTVQPTLNIKTLCSMPIPMPSKEQIEKSVTILNVLDQKIRTNAQINDNLAA